ncbi:tetratricopeptide repeat protein [Streptomyces griseoruber]|uniref:tetratricopeptide repeat protein n=1 Tax=Streptomyces griseoruber TaxID=1943 RepID=UPI0037979AA6
MREEEDQRESAEALYRRAADQGNTRAPMRLTEMREKAGDREGAETLAWRAADHGSVDALLRLAEIREEARDPEGAEALYRQAADHGHTNPLHHPPETQEVLSRLWPYGLDPDGTPTPPWQPSVSALFERTVPPGTS